MCMAADLRTLTSSNPGGPAELQSRKYEILSRHELGRGKPLIVDSSPNYSSRSRPNMEQFPVSVLGLETSYLSSPYRLQHDSSHCSRFEVKESNVCCVLSEETHILYNESQVKLFFYMCREGLREESMTITMYQSVVLDKVKVVCANTVTFCLVFTST